MKLTVPGGSRARLVEWLHPGNPPSGRDGACPWLHVDDAPPSRGGACLPGVPHRASRSRWEALALVGGALMLTLAWRRRVIARRHSAHYDYGDRSGMPDPERMRGLARDYEVSRDFRTPEALRPLERTPRA